MAINSKVYIAQILPRKLAECNNDPEINNQIIPLHPWLLFSPDTGAGWIQISVCSVLGCKRQALTRQLGNCQVLSKARGGSCAFHLFQQAAATRGTACVLTTLRAGRAPAPLIRTDLWEAGATNWQLSAGIIRELQINLHAEVAGEKRKAKYIFLGFGIRDQVRQEWEFLSKIQCLLSEA